MLGRVVLDRISFSYGDSLVLDQISAVFRSNQLVGLSGLNGSGKTTLVHLLMGLLTPESGQLSFEGEFEEKTPFARGYLLFQNPDNQIVGTTVGEDAAFCGENLGVERDELLNRVDTALRKVGLLHLRDQAPVHLSGGQKQRLALAGALVSGSRFLILDEPFAMLDKPARREFMDLLLGLTEAGYLVLMIAHQPEELQHADAIFYMSQGTLLEVDPQKFSDVGLPELAMPAPL